MLQKQLINILKINYFSKRLPRFQYFFKKTHLLRDYIRLQFNSLERGESAKNFEKKMRLHFKSEHCLTTSSFRMGLFYSLKSLGLEEGDEVLLTPITIPETINAILILKLKPVFVEISLDDHSVDIEKLKNYITPRSKVLLVTYLSGITPDMNKIVNISKENNLIFIEDFSQNYEAKCEEKYLGTWGDIGIGSLSSGKIISAPIGGVIFTQSNLHAERIRQEIESLIQAPTRNVLSYYVKNCLKVEFATTRLVYTVLTHSVLRFLSLFSKEGVLDFEHEPENKNNIFYTYRPVLRTEFPKSFRTWLSDWQAELAMDLLGDVTEKTKKRRELAEVLCNNLSSHSKNLVPLNLMKFDCNSYYHFPIYCFGLKKELRKYLFENGIDNGSYGLNLCTKEEIFSSYSKILKNAERVKYDTIFLPLNEKYSNGHMKYLAHLVNNFVIKHKLDVAYNQVTLIHEQEV